MVLAFRLGLFSLFACVAIAAASAQAPLHCSDSLSEPGCGIPLHTPSGSGGTNSAQQTMDRINRNTEQQLRNVNDVFNVVNDVAKQYLNSRSSQSSGDGASSGSSFNAGSSLFDSGDEASGGVQDTFDQVKRQAHQQEHQQKEADAALEESCQLLIAAAAQSGTTVDLAGNNACSRQIDAYLYRTTRYMPGGRPAPQSPGVEPVIDGSKIPKVIDFPRRSTPASDDPSLEELLQLIDDELDVDSVSGSSLDRLVSSIAAAPGSGAASKPIQNKN